MNRYPLWKYIVIGVSLLLGFLYTLPNFYGNEPAVQISADKSTVKIEAATVQRVESILNLGKVPYLVSPAIAPRCDRCPVVE